MVWEVFHLLCILLRLRMLLFGHRRLIGQAVSNGIQSYTDIIVESPVVVGIKDSVYSDVCT